MDRITWKSGLRGAIALASEAESLSLRSLRSSGTDRHDYAASAAASYRAAAAMAEVAAKAMAPEEPAKKPAKAKAKPKAKKPAKAKK